jgi:formylmethanofuran dehydrogenase subunit E
MQLRAYGRLSGTHKVVRFGVCPKCHELVAEPYLRVAHGELLCIACAGYHR